ncbi:sulfite exporter TauE/SafE family protein [Aquirufa rosea]|uniref:Sulfite exporter TauE/SafE family protein n=1 Tax=Aquirufa rosea TaxID=2509241 RepID=A0A4Q1C2H5_9BACT|nr:sulfite exporter TauE/SafE family protein [Aquirufa rosea]RXK52378.1 sulfite exporter TauE/SafE family protein [Aquirufa rosea]
MHTWYLSFFIGLAGSWHCIAMCGPIMLHVRQKNQRLANVSTVMYQFGRILTYSLMGLVVASLGSIWIFPNWWHLYYIVAGLILLFLSIGKLKDSYFDFLYRWIGKPLQQSGRGLGTWGHFLLGMGNGLLPCGLVTGGLSIALIQPSPIGGALTMFVFGISTLPAITAAILSLDWLEKRQSNALRYVKLLSWAVAIILLFRGAWGIGMSQSNYLKNSSLSPIICHPFSAQ